MEEGAQAKRWHHLNLFQKFALIFFCVVALPVLLIAVYVLGQNQASILDSTTIFTDAVTTLMEDLSESHQHESELMLNAAQQEFLELTNHSLVDIKTSLLDRNKDLYATGIQALVEESQGILEAELRALNHEVAQGVVTLIEHFTHEARMIMQALASPHDFQSLTSGQLKQFEALFASHEQCVHLSFFTSDKRRVASLTKPAMTAQDLVPMLTNIDSYVTAVVSGTQLPVQVLFHDGIPWLRFFTSVHTDSKHQGVFMGIMNVALLWNHIHTRFSQHEEQIYIIDKEGTILYKPLGSAGIRVTPDQLSSLSNRATPTGFFQQEDLMFSYSTEPDLQWKIVVVQPVSSLTARIAPIHDLVLRDSTDLEDTLTQLTQQKLSGIEQKISKKSDAQQEDIRKKIQQDYARLAVSNRQRVTDQVAMIAKNVHQDTLRKTIPVILVLGVLAVMLGILVAGAIIRPIKHMTAVARDLSLGDVSQTVPVMNTHDEIGLLSHSFHETTEYLRHIARSAQHISEGEFSDQVTPVSEHDFLGNAFRKMTEYLREIAGLATDISHGDLSRVVTPKSDADVLGNAVYRMTLYLQRIAHTVKTVAGGNLSEELPLQSDRDVLGKAFAEMIVKLRHLVSRIRTGAEQLVTLGMETHSRAQKEAESVEKISLSVEETSSSMNQMAATISEVNERMKQLSSFVGESSSSIEQLNSSIRQIATHGEQLAAASDDTSSSIQEISASLQQIADTAQHSKMLSDGARQDAVSGREAVEKMIQSMNVIEHMVTVTAEAIQLLNRRTESIDTILDVIKDISDQTSLLSINASIIAKKAGERGRGFNVIADKVRLLADQSNSSAKEIAKIIRDVRKESSHAVEVVSMGKEKVLEGVTLAELAGKALDKVITGANESSSVVAKIAETTDEQTKISQYIMGSMEQVVEMVNQIKVATKEQELSSSYIMKQAEQVLMHSQQVKQATNEQTEVVRHVSIAMDDIRTLIEMTSARAKESTQSASLLSHHADALKQLVSQFTI